jgi:GNAT superfamily N-acetyltransferase
MTPSNAIVGDVRFRPATEADLEAQHRIFCRALGDLFRRHSFAWEDPPFDAFGPALAHLLRHDSNRCFVAELDGRIVGYTAALVRGDFWFFGALFIDPDHQGRGIGRALFELAHRDAPSRQATITDSIQPVSNALYAKHGLIPTTPIFLFTTPPAGRSASARASIETATVPFRPVEGTPADLLAIDLGVYGVDRAIDHDFWGSGAERTVWARGGSVVAYSYAWPSGRIGPVAGTDEASAADALRHEIDRHDQPWVEIPGSARKLVEVALESGLRIEPPPGLLLLSPEMEPPRALAISRYLHY